MHASTTAESASGPCWKTSCPDSSQAEQVEDQLVEPVGLLLDPVQKTDVDVFIMERPVEQRLGVCLDRRQRGLQLVRDVRHEVLPHPLEPAELGDVVKDQHRTRRRSAGQERPVNRQHAGDRPQRPLAAFEDDLASVAIRPGEGGVDGFLDVGTADQLGHEPADGHHPQPEQPIRALVGEQQPPPRVDRDHPLGHAAENHAKLLDLAFEPADPLLEDRHRQVEPSRQPAERAEAADSRRPRGLPLGEGDQAGFELIDERAKADASPGDGRRRGDRHENPPDPPGHRSPAPSNTPRRREAVSAGRTGSVKARGAQGGAVAPGSTPGSFARQSSQAVQPSVWARARASSIVSNSASGRVIRRAAPQPFQ
jgi:hypothetical protein